MAALSRSGPYGAGSTSTPEHRHSALSMPILAKSLCGITARGHAQMGSHWQAVLQLCTSSLPELLMHARYSSSQHPRNQQTHNTGCQTALTSDGHLPASKCCLGMNRQVQKNRLPAYENARLRPMTTARLVQTRLLAMASGLSLGNHVMAFAKGTKQRQRRCCLVFVAMHL